MELLNLQPVELPRRIVRRLQDGPDYRPDWRFRVVEGYLLDIAKAEEKSSRINAILQREGDPYVRQLLRFQSGWRCVIVDPVEYALRCRATNPENRIGSLIKAMTVANRTAQQIAREVGTDPLNIIAFQKIFFDVGRYLDRRAWLKQLCFPVYQHQPSAEEECEARWLQIAFLRGWPGLAPVVSKSREVSSITGKATLSRLVQVLSCRSGDYFAGLEMAGITPTEHDVRLLLLLQRAIEGLGLPLTLEDLDFSEPLDPEEERRQNELKAEVSKLSPFARRKIIAILEYIRSDKPLRSFGQSALPDKGEKASG